MGDWFRTANPSNKFHSNKLFHNRCKMILSGIFENDDDSNFDHFRFMDLKATSGGSATGEDIIADYINEHIEEVLEFFISTNENFGLYPHLVIILGNHAYNTFSKYIRHKLIDVNSQIQWVCMPHPSAQTVVNDLMKNACYEITKKLEPIDKRPYKWFCNGKSKFGWKKV